MTFTRFQFSPSPEVTSRGSVTETFVSVPPTASQPRVPYATSSSVCLPGPPRLMDFQLCQFLIVSYTHL